MERLSLITLCIKIQTLTRTQSAHVYLHHGAHWVQRGNEIGERSKTVQI